MKVLNNKLDKLNKSSKYNKYGKPGMYMYVPLSEL